MPFKSVTIGQIMNKDEMLTSFCFYLFRFFILKSDNDLIVINRQVDIIIIIIIN